MCVTCGDHWAARTSALWTLSWDRRTFVTLFGTRMAGSINSCRSGRCVSPLLDTGLNISHLVLPALRTSWICSFFPDHPFLQNVPSQRTRHGPRTQPSTGEAESSLGRRQTAVPTTTGALLLEQGPWQQAGRWGEGRRGEGRGQNTAAPDPPPSGGQGPPRGSDMGKARQAEGRSVHPGPVRSAGAA